jgi:D-alanyl-D-alanine carboxypeptidase
MTPPTPPERPFSAGARLATGPASRSLVGVRSGWILAPLGLVDTVVASTSPDLPEPHAHGYCRYQDGDHWLHMPQPV